MNAHELANEIEQRVDMVREHARRHELASEARVIVDYLTSRELDGRDGHKRLHAILDELEALAQESLGIVTTE